MARDCGNRTCDVEFRLQATCRIFVDAAADLICNYPCSTENCIVENHYWINCPNWICEDKVTTTQAPSPSSTVPPPQPGPSAGYWASVGFNGLCLMAFGVILLVFLNRKFKIRTSNDDDTSSGLSNPLFDDGHDYFVNQNPIIRHAERLPLLPLRNVPSSIPANFDSSRRGSVGERQRIALTDQPLGVDEASQSARRSGTVALAMNETHF